MQVRLEFQRNAAWAGREVKRRRSVSLAAAITIAALNGVNLKRAHDGYITFSWAVIAVIGQVAIAGGVVIYHLARVRKIAYLARVQGQTAPISFVGQYVKPPDERGLVGREYCYVRINRAGLLAQSDDGITARLEGGDIDEVVFSSVKMAKYGWLQVTTRDGRRYLFSMSRHVLHELAHHTDNLKGGLDG